MTPLEQRHAELADELADVTMWTPAEWRRLIAASQTGLPVPQQIVDRDALLSELRAMLREEYEGFLSDREVVEIAEYQAGRILALLRRGVDS